MIACVVIAVLLTEGEVHKRHRRIASGAFHFDSLQALIPLIASCTNAAVDGWLAKGEAAPPECEAVDGGGWVELEFNRII